MSVEHVTGRSWRALVLLAELVVSLLLGAAVWAAWLGWDHSYYYDPVVGAYQGPYRQAQVVACALTVGLLTALLALRWNPVVVAAGITVGFWVVWTVQAGSEDDSGLFLVGSILLLGGLVLGTTVASAVGYRARPLVHRLRDRRQQPPHPDLPP
ncbi:MAG: hypothetical protein H0T17_03440 [Propionibacteriales bacterium]|nr:hypothetical protein [Propionibacteriales bacterium]